ncbi:DUF4245 domain-containing protein [Frondihabitans cladoniiphilus]|uniref:DUF4245 domain-containing protein n=1 Tax=Frondihabitans cladoniiphilus TaxID=715785 RepID=A0ABP8VTI2_9MICO
MTGTPPPPLGRQRPPRVVAELGRPETPEETAFRKATSSRNHRLNQTSKNLILSLIASVGVVILLVLVVVRPGGSELKTVDYRSIAADAQQQVTEPLVAPALPKTWKSNSATITQSDADGVQTWYIGFITPGTSFIGLTQGIKANRTWVSDQLQQGKQTSSITIGGLDWSIYDRRTENDPGNLAYAMVTTSGKSTVILAGTAPTQQFDLLAEKASATLTK